MYSEISRYIVLSTPIALILLGAYVCKRYLGYSNINLFKELMIEFRQTATIPWTPAAINAITLIASILLIFLYFAGTGLDKLVRLAFKLDSSAPLSFPELIGSIVVLACLAMACILICHRRSGSN